jgi:hypothetical protein
MLSLRSLNVPLLAAGFETHAGAKKSADGISL